METPSLVSDVRASLVITVKLIYQKIGIGYPKTNYVMSRELWTNRFHPYVIFFML
jgi:hypothetical protein